MKPYQKKAAPKSVRTYRKWTIADDALIRSSLNLSAKELAMLIGCDVKAIYNRRACLRKRDEAERFVHVVDDDLKAINALERAMNAPVRKADTLSDAEQRAKLKTFRLYEGLFDEPKDEPQPSLWARIKKLFTK